MAESLHTRILNHLKNPAYRPVKSRALARELNAHREEEYPAFKEALRNLEEQGKVVVGRGRNIELPPPPKPAKASKPVTNNQPTLTRGMVVGSYRHNRRGFGFVIPTDPPGHEDLFIPEGYNAGAMSDDIVRAQITGSDRRDGRMRYEGRITEVIQRVNNRFVGSLERQHNLWMVLPDGNDFTDPILTPDAASRHIKPGTKVVVELTIWPEDGKRAQGVITDVLGQAGEKDVDLRSIIVQYNMPGEFPGEVRTEARAALDRFNATLKDQQAGRLDLTDDLICTIDPDDAKDYDDAISLRQLENGHWQLGVHIADVAFFVPEGSALDQEANKRGNSAYFPGHVIPMLPEILSNGVCSLQEGVPRLCKSAFIELDDHAKPVAAKFANTIIRSAKRLRYREAQAILDNVAVIPHPEGARRLADYDPAVVQLLRDMDALAKRIQKRRHAAGQLVLGLPEIDLVLNEEGKVIGAVPEDESYTHTIIEMFMVEANEAVARLLDGLDVPFLHRAHAEPPIESSERLRAFVQVAGYRLPKIIDRKALQQLLASVKGKPESFAVNLAVLKSLSRAEYSPQSVGHYALASEFYGHFTSPIRRYADLTIHRLLDSYLQARREKSPHSRKRKLQLDQVVPFEQLVELGKHLSVTERRADEAENELRRVKILELLQNRIGDEFHGVVTGITKFGIFIQLQEYLIDGLIRYEDLMDDYWEVDERAGLVRGRRTGRRIGIGDQARVLVVKVDLPRRELDLAVAELIRGTHGHSVDEQPHRPGKHKHKPMKTAHRVPKKRGRGKRHQRGHI
ncbi:MAG: ribonuclease R [Phycisphaerales bacterium]|jgi:ribonuclease R|nr:ribonuclease R [Phycisphaerales bacterium]